MSILYPDLSNTTFPNVIQNFTQVLNIVAEDAPLIKQYQTAIQNGDMSTANRVYNQISNAGQKIIDANKVNTIYDTILAIERFFKSDIYPYLTQKQEEWQNIIDLFSYKNLYNPSVTYYKNNFVLYNNNIYIAIQNVPLGTAPSNTTYWRILTVKGAKGDAGVGLSFNGLWNSTTTYTSQSVVTYENIVWGATQDNTNQPPYEGSPYWNKLGELSTSVYPVSSTQPVGQEEGELWFQIV